MPSSQIYLHHFASIDDNIRNQKKRDLCNQKRHHPTTQFQTNNNLLNKSFRSFPSQKIHFFYLFNSTQQPLRKTHHSISFTHSIHSFILRHSQSTYIFLLINNILLSNSIHSSIKQTTNQHLNNQIHQSTNSLIHPILPIQQPIFRLFNSFFNNILCLF